MMYKLIWKYIVARAKEPSTWRGIVTAATASGVALKPQWADFIVTVGVALFTALSALPDKIEPETKPE